MGCMKTLQMEVMEALERKSPKEAFMIYQKKTGASEEEVQTAIFEINALMKQENLNQIGK